MTTNAEPVVERAPEWLRVACILVIGLSALLVMTFDYGRDQSIYALVAREMLHGGMPYKDAFDFKPPGIFLVYAVARALFGADQSGIRVLEVFSLCGSAWLLVVLSKRHFRTSTAGWIAAAITSQLHAQLDFWHTAQPETFGGTLTLAALFIAPIGTFTPPGSERRVILRWIAVGALFGGAGLMKPPLAGAAAIVALTRSAQLFYAARATASVGSSVKTILLPILAGAVGGLLPIALVGVWFDSTGAMPDLKEVLFVFTPYYTKLSWEGVSTTGMIYYGFTEWLTGYSGLLLAGLVCLALARPRERERTFVYCVLGCIGMHVAGIVMQGKFFPYHWAATFPLTALLAGRGINLGFERVSRAGLLGQGSLAAALAVAWLLRAPVPSFGDTFIDRSKLRLSLLSTGTAQQWDALASVADVNAAENRAVAELIKERTRGRETEPIFVWGFECVIYDLAERPLSSRYIYNVPQRAEWSKGPMQAALMRDLAARPPLVIVVEHRDVFAQVTGNNDDSARALWGFPQLLDLVQNDYTHIETVGDFDVYLRNDEEP